MATLNQCTFIGRLGKDPVLEVTTTGKPYSKFSLAVDQGKDQPPMWLNIITWEKLAETVAMYAHKGMQVFVQGKLVLRTYKDKNNSERIEVDLEATNNPHRNQLESSLQAKLAQVMQLHSKGLGKGEIIQAVWGITPGTSKAYKQAQEEYTKLMQYLMQHANEKIGA